MTYSLASASTSPQIVRRVLCFSRNSRVCCASASALADSRVNFSCARACLVLKVSSSDLRLFTSRMLSCSFCSQTRFSPSNCCSSISFCDKRKSLFRASSPFEGQSCTKSITLILGSLSSLFASLLPKRRIPDMPLLLKDDDIEKLFGMFGMENQLVEPTFASVASDLSEVGVACGVTSFAAALSFSICALTREVLIDFISSKKTKKIGQNQALYALPQLAT
mmetsp:Transcript_17799/g.29927  ORF Transcript_17799/g.29927 Transcript_17799/m.29927 type:complete len:222 (+) Transcript_17799:609-1274(+)